jgi:toxin ParE1/3/4
LEICSHESSLRGGSGGLQRIEKRVRKSPQAEVDLASIWDFIADDSLKAADALLDRIEKVFDMLARTPMAGRARGDLVPSLRSFPAGSYVIFYVPVPDGIEVVRVMSSRQDVDADDMA